jgi:hypothetical protein
MVRDVKCLQECRLQIHNQLVTCTRNVLYLKNGSKVKNCICLIGFLVFMVFMVFMVLILTVYPIQRIYEIFCGRQVD